MNKELIYVIEQIGREKGIGKEVLFEALESALLSASKKTMGVADNVRMELDRHTGVLRVFARKKVVETVADAKLEITLEEARKLNAEAELEDELEIELPPQEFGRIAAQTAKQVILQRVRDAERDAVYSEFIDKRGQDRPRHRPPHREAQRDRGHRQGRGRAHGAGADPRRALQSERPRARLCAWRSRSGQGPADPALARRTPASSCGCSRRRSPRSPRVSSRCKRPPASRGARQGRRRVHQA